MKFFCFILLTAAVGFIACPLAFAADPAPTTTTSRPSPSIAVVQVVHDIDNTRLDTERLTVTLNLVPGPTMHLAYIQNVVPADKAMDDKGNSLAFKGSVPSDLHPGMYGSAQSRNALVKVLLNPPGSNAEAGKTIQYIEGVIPAAIITKTDTVDLPTAGKAKRDYPNGVKAEFSIAMTSPTVCSVQYSFDLPRELSDAERNMWTSQGISIKIKVIDDQKQTWRPGGGGNTTSSGANHFSLIQSYTIPFGGVAGAPPSVSFEVITETQTINIPFRVENIPLP